MTHDCGEHRHDDERTKCANKDRQARMTHGEDSGDEERFVPYFRDDDHGERLK